ncbi:MAG: PilN domain-containing protein [Myxococcaceae bacterium]
MMIRINLLPVRQVQKREAGRQFIVMMVGALIIAVAGNAYGFIWLDGKREVAQRRLDDTTARIAQLDKVIGEVKDLDKRKEEVEKKLAELEKLLTERKGPVKMLDALQSAIPKKAWISAFTEKGGAASMSGAAESYDDVSEFMRALKNVMWTPKGMGRVVERKRSGGYRVEMMGTEGAIEEFTDADLKGRAFFDNIELKSSSASSKGKGVTFEMSLTANMKL